MIYISNQYKAEYILSCQLSGSFRVGQYVLLELGGLDESGEYKSNYCGEIKRITHDSILVVSDQNENRGIGGYIPISDIKTITLVYRIDEKTCGGFIYDDDVFTPSFGIYCKDDIEQNTW
ncbi:hypothetical protein [Konateibacter massiliensis]|uniref:hypothetical protein n=1 Tax=Konateibacter massiliensis TaxID=2002841 RepID=UPI000C156AE9|nr:hypothetical protein [Konateibacter massiliensis]